MENTVEEISFEMTDTILKIAGMIVTLLSTIVKAVELAEKYRHQKSNRDSQQK